jgi:LysM repeat protein
MLKLVYNNYREAELYTAKSGETMASIAKKFHMTVSDLKALNNTKKNSFKPKKKILVYAKPAPQKGRDSAVTSTYVPQLASRDTSLKPKPGPANGSDSGKAKTSVKQAETVEASGTTHVVKTGETLGSIAGKYGCTTSDLMKWNNLNNTIIIVGQKIKVASAGREPVAYVKPEPVAKPKSSSSVAQKFTLYTIQSGDNLWDIADKFDVTVSQIKTMNNFKNYNQLKPGQKIKIPK